MKYSRRNFVKTSALATFSFGISSSAFSFAQQLKSKVTLGVISDLHHDLIPDGVERLQDFLQEVTRKKPQSIIQMGDFAFPSPENQHLVNLFNDAHTSVFHLIGNHDMDEGYTKEDCLEAWKIPNSYYSSEVAGLKLIFLDGNDPGSPTHKGGYPSYIGSAQQKWLRSELESSKLPVVIFSHQPLAGIYPIDNTAEIQALLSAFSQKIILALNGHAHVTQHLQIGGVHYVHINSASYYWVGAKFKHKSLSPSIHMQYPSLEFTCPYQNSLFAFVTIDPKTMKISIKGKKTNWIGPSPAELGYDIVNQQELRDHVKPEIEDRLFEK
jgi:hypothetical protein